jgi:integrase
VQPPAGGTWRALCFLSYGAHDSRFFDLSNKERKAPASYAVDKRGAEIAKTEIGHLRPAEVSVERLEQIQHDLMAGKLTGNALTRESAARYLNVFRLAFKIAVRENLVAASPFSVMEAIGRTPGKTRFEWSPEATLGLLSAAERHSKRGEARQDYYPYLAFQVYTGARPSEGIALQVRDVDLLNGRVTIRHSLLRDGTLGPTKTRKVRTIPIPDVLVDVLARVIPGDADPDDFVFHAKGDPKTPLSYWNIRNRGLIPALKDAGLDGNGIGLHDLRHAAASLLISEGLSPVEVAEHLGHSSPVTTMKVYAHQFDRGNRESRVREAFGVLAPREGV